MFLHHFTARLSAVYKTVTVLSIRGAFEKDSAVRLLVVPEG